MTRDEYINNIDIEQFNSRVLSYEEYKKEIKRANRESRSLGLLDEIEEPLSEEDYVKAVEEERQEYIMSKTSDRKKFLRRLTPEIEELFLQYPSHMDKFYADSDYRDRTPNYFVYEASTPDEKKYYVGISNDPDFHFNFSYYKLTAYIYEHKGLNVTRLIEGLNHYQATVYMYSKIAEYCAKGEYLVNREASEFLCKTKLVPKEHDAGSSFVYMELALKHFMPEVYERDESFDEIEEDILTNVMFQSNQNDKAVKWLQDKGTKITKTCTPLTKSVIVDKEISFWDYNKYRKQGKKVLAIEDLLDYIQKHPIEHTETKKTVKVPQYDKEKRDEIRLFLETNYTKIEKYYQQTLQKPKDPRALTKIWIEPFTSEALKSSNPSEKIKPALIEIIKTWCLWKKNPGRNSCANLIKLYKKEGLFDEIVALLKEDGSMAAELSKYQVIAENDHRK